MRRRQGVEGRRRRQLQGQCRDDLEVTNHCAHLKAGFDSCRVRLRAPHVSRKWKFSPGALHARCDDQND